MAPLPFSIQGAMISATTSSFMNIFSQGASTALVLFSLTVATWAGSKHPAIQYVEGDAIVTFKPSVTLTNAKQKLADHSLAWKHRFTQLSEFRGRETGVVHSGNRTTMQLIAELKNDPAVETAEPNYLRWFTTVTPNDTFFTNQWALQNTGQTIFNGSLGDVTGTAGADIRFIPAWALAPQPGTNRPGVAV